MNEFNLFLDMDGFAFDFDNSYRNFFGDFPETKAEMWLNIETRPLFFRHLPLMDGFLEFYTRYWHLNPIFLTHVPSHNAQNVADQKILALRESVDPNARMIAVPNDVHKWQYMRAPGDVLIDDWGKNIIPWEQHGGIGIKHYNFTLTTAELEWILHRNTMPIGAVS